MGRVFKWMLNIITVTIHQKKPLGNTLGPFCGSICLQWCTSWGKYVFSAKILVNSIEINNSSSNPSSFFCGKHAWPGSTNSQQVWPFVAVLRTDSFALRKVCKGSKTFFVGKSPPKPSRQLVKRSHTLWGKPLRALTTISLRMGFCILWQYVDRTFVIKLLGWRNMGLD